MKKIILLSMVYFAGTGCASLPAAAAPAAPPPPVQAQGRAPLTEQLLNNARKELKLARESYAAGDMAGSEQAAIRAARIIYTADFPDNGEGRHYAEISSELALLTVRLNRFLHGVSPELEPEAFTMPIPYNPRIERQIDYYLTRGREGFARWLRRSGRYVPALKKYFIRQGLPGDMVYLALVESGFNPRNRSPKHAVGLFQFIKGTAELVGLKENHWLDERRHPDKAARAAVKHLKSLYREFHNWDLSLAAYNAGSGRVKRAMRAQGIKNYWRLALPPETEAYVPKFYATLIIAKEPELYGFNPDMETETGAEETEVPGGVDFKVIAECLGTSLSVVVDLNPELTKGCTPPGPETYLLLLPGNTGEKFLAAFADLPDKKKYLSREELSRRKFKGVYFVYKIKSGDSLYTIARKHHTTVAKLRRWNPGTRRSKYIHPGKKLRIYRRR